MTWVTLPLATKSAKARSTASSPEELVNLDLIENPQGSPQPFTLYGSPGKKRFATIDETKPTRGLARIGDTLMAVVGSMLYAVPPSGIARAVGAIDGSRPVRIDTNGTQLVIAADSAVYVADAASVKLAGISGLLGVVCQDGYIIGPEADTQNIFSSAVDDPITWPGLNITQADAHGDLNVGCIGFGQQYWHFKEKSFEAYADAGNAVGFPFSRQAVVDRGCAAAGSIAKGDVIAWLGDDRRVYIANGYQPKRISTPEVELSIDAQASVSDAEAYIYSQNGQTFYVLNLPGVTWACDLDSGRWSQRVTRGLTRDRSLGYVYLNGKSYTGDYQRGIIYEIDPKTFTDDGSRIERIATCPAIDAGGVRQCMNEVELQIETGVGTLDTQRSAYLEWSEDGGKTWCDPQQASIGKLGNYHLRCTWTRLGSYHNRILRFRVLDTAFVAIRGARARIEGGI